MIDYRGDKIKKKITNIIFAIIFGAALLIMIAIFASGLNENFKTSLDTFYSDAESLMANVKYWIIDFIEKIKRTFF